MKEKKFMTFTDVYEAEEKNDTKSNYERIMKWKNFNIVPGVEMDPAKLFEASVKSVDRWVNNLDKIQDIYIIFYNMSNAEESVQQQKEIQDFYFERKAFTNVFRIRT